MILIKIAKDFSMLPGGRFIKDGINSGELFRESILAPNFEKSKLENDQLVVDFDGGYGYGSSFLEEAFGGLARKTHDSDLLKIKLISEEEPAIIDKVYGYIRESLKR